MYTVTNELFVDPADTEVFERNFAASMRGTLTGVPGLRAARLLRPETADRGYLSVLEFEDAAAYSAYRSSDAFTAAHTWPDHAPIRSARLTTYDMLSEVAL
ncbi:antibiotic biosynthesis monooxygenase family protein [Nocardia stercoris]|uniref:antibiotic biosynthesis monooxygenase family protein n=1 Tax=Nocardia stercoris TaxID=2483361 RepID=UPI001319C786|nr:antibiotic biosynthesis monooxygenase family protein [Nocardia stercoris]